MKTTGVHDQSHAAPLSDQLVGISISDSDGLSRRGLLPVHLDRALAEIATLLAAAGARIGYGGHLEPDGFTHKLFRSVAELYGRPCVAGEAPPCIHYLAMPIWQKMAAADLIEHVQALDGTVEVVLVAVGGLGYSLRLEKPRSRTRSSVVRLARRLPRSGPGTGSRIMQQTNDRILRLYESAYAWHANHIPATSPPRHALGEESSDPRFEAPVDIQSPTDLGQFLGQFRDRLGELGISDASAYTELRLFMAADEDARVVLGGKTRDYAGHFPGIAEEALYSLLAGNRVVGLRSFGGCATDTVDALLTGTSRVRAHAGPGTTTVLGSLAAGSDVFLDTLNRSGLSDLYPQTASLESPRTMAIGVLKCLKQTRWREASSAEAGDFQKAVL